MRYTSDAAKCVAGQKSSLFYYFPTKMGCILPFTVSLRAVPVFDIIDVSERGWTKSGAILVAVAQHRNKNKICLFRRSNGM